MHTSSRRRRHGLDIWPGFVDALSALLMVVIFALMAFVLSQLYLTYTLNNREEKLEVLNEQLEREQKQKDKIAKEANELQKLLTLMRTQVAGLDKNLSELNQGKEEALKEKTLATTENKSLSEQIEALTQELSTLRKQFKETETENVTEKEKNEILASRLTHIATENEKLKTRDQGFNQFRSEFMGKLQKAIGTRSDIRIVGDRFVFQSEVFFEKASADLGKEGKTRLDELIRALQEIAKKIPEDTKWILRVDGHTDKRPINSSQFPSNWELAAARAISVVKYLVANGIPADHLVVAGFGEFQPLITYTQDDKELARNRRIEFKLDQR